MKFITKIFLPGFLVLLMMACSQLGERLGVLDGSGDSESGWAHVAGDFRGQRHSELSQINVDTISQLGLAWYVDLPRDGGLQATPIIIDNVLYFSTAWSRVFAVDARTGETIWKFDPEVDRSIEACCGPNNRGVAYADGRVFVGAYDGRLIALDAVSGEVLWSTQTVDEPKPGEGEPRYTITGAPVVAGDKVLIGNGGAEFAVRGYVSVFDAKTGEQLWRFYTVPGDPAKPFENPILEMAATTWHGEWWKVGGGGTVYDALAYDPEFNLFYIGVGNSAPYNPLIRTDGKGDNLFVASIVALDADTGKYVWHYQTTPGDSWDYTATQNMILADLEIEGQVRKVLMQAPKNGFYYVLDRETGEYLSAEAYEKVTWAEGVDENGRPIINEDAKYWLKDGPVVVYPSMQGAHNWYPMAYSPDTGLTYIPATHSPQQIVAQSPEDFKMNPRGRNTGVGYGGALGTANPDALVQAKKAFTGSLIAWDPVKQETRWTIPYDELGNGGVLSTGGNLILHGTTKRDLVAYNATTGEKLWSFDAQTSIIAAPMSYELDGEQYIAVLASRGGGLGRIAGRLYDQDLVNRARLLVFKLGGENSLPVPNDSVVSLPDLSGVKVDDALVQQGGKLYGKYCAFCHGLDAVGSSVVPDLRYSAIVQNQQIFDQVVLDGLFSSRGMVSFDGTLSKQETVALRDYIIYENQLSRKHGDVTRIGR